MTFPNFKYHPDPITTGSTKESDTVCERCGEARGDIYTGRVFSEKELADCICPWCIANGESHKKSMPSLRTLMELTITDHGKKYQMKLGKKYRLEHPAFRGGNRWFPYCLCF